MKHHLTERQKEYAQLLAKLIKERRLSETFTDSHLYSVTQQTGGQYDATGSRGILAALEKAGMIIRSAGTYIVTSLLQSAVDSDFSDDPPTPPLSTIAHAAPPELNISLDRLRARYPEPAKLGFLVMRFTTGPAFEAIVTAIKDAAASCGIEIVRADERQYHADLWGNVRTHLHGCSFGIAVYERIETNEPNANVGLEVGYLMAMNKPVLLLKERTLPALQADLMGKLYKVFDAHDPAGTIPTQLTAWLEDNGIIVPGRP